MCFSVAHGESFFVTSVYTSTIFLIFFCYYDDCSFVDLTEAIDANDASFLDNTEFQEADAIPTLNEILPERHYLDNEVSIILLFLLSLPRVMSLQET